MYIGFHLNLVSLLSAISPPGRKYFCCIGRNWVITVVFTMMGRNLPTLHVIVADVTQNKILMWQWSMTLVRYSFSAYNLTTSFFKLHHMFSYLKTQDFPAIKSG